jgi:hypothetical protein
MMNKTGIFVMRGADAQEIEDKINNLYLTLDTSMYLPTMAAATIFGYRVMLCNGRFTDPFGRTRNLLLMWHPVQGRPFFWSVATQNLELTHIGTYEQDSLLRPYGTDGKSLYLLFAKPDPTLIKRLSTKSLRGQGIAQLTIKNFKRLYCELRDNFGGGVGITGTLTTGIGGIPGGVEDVGFQLTQGRKHELIPYSVHGQGIQGHLDLESYSPDFTIERLHVAAEERTLFGA